LLSNRTASCPAKRKPESLIEIGAVVKLRNKTWKIKGDIL
jgi:hypothetical protein